METAKLKKFASFARKSLIEQISTKMKTVLANGSLARRENPKAVAELEAKIAEVGKPQTIEMVAYTWFNRFCALRYMDVNRYTKIGILSPADGQFLPEILGEAKAGHIDEEIVPAATREKVLRILDGTDPSDNPQGEAYRLLLVAACNHYHSLMPFLFEKISDYTELLLPDDLLSGSAIPTCTREALLPANCSPEHTEESVEVIGWLYQFYIADKKDDVFAALKKGKKITPENIPAATQLFTPHWIVRYLVENSLGRLWMLNHPESKLAERMDYYIRPEETETDFLKIASPEEIKVCDPACGSGHMLTYAFDLLFEIYRELNYPETEIPALILTHNLYGVEIDDRAGALAAFALTMKAREKYRRFLSPGKIVQPNICVLENISVDPQELDDYMDKVGRDLFTGDLQGVVSQWEEAENFGSLIRPMVTDVSEVLETLRKSKVSEDLLIAGMHQKVLVALKQADYLSPKYHVVVANPPYMGRKSMNLALKKYGQDSYSDNKIDIFAMFIERSAELAVSSGNIAMITMHSWMFLSSYEKLRTFLLLEATPLTVAHLGERAFDSIGGAVVSTAAFVFKKSSNPDYPATYIRLVDGESENEKNQMLLHNSDLRFVVRAKDFMSVPRTPFSYWLSDAGRKAFALGTPFEEIAAPRVGMATTDNNRFIRLWPEVSFSRIGFSCKSTAEASKSGRKWFPYNKGGSFRKWFGNLEYVVNYENDGAEMKKVVKEKYRDRDYAQGFTEEKWDKLIEVWVLKNQHSYFLPSLTWSFVSTASFGVRRSDPGFVFDVGGSSAFLPDSRLNEFAAYLCSKVAGFFMAGLNPTLNFQVENVAALPVLKDSFARIEPKVSAIAEEAIAISRTDWNSSETAWNHECNVLLATGKKELLSESYTSFQAQAANNISRMQELEGENNKMFIDVFQLSGDLDPMVPIGEITLSSNPSYRYGTDKTDSELEALLLADTMREFISYAVGCMLGRYSLDKPGLILANQGDTFQDYLRILSEHQDASGENPKSKIENPKFLPDEDNVIPILDGDWFTDDISERFKEFLKITFGTEHYADNLKFLEDALYPENTSGRKRKMIRDYFLKDFFDHHIKLYKKRPIYWLFSSPKGTFNALIYMHRYRPDTVSTVLQYLRDFRDKLAHRRDHQQMVADSAGSTTVEKTKALKEVTAIKKQLKELEDYERDTLFPLAQKKITIDLDDGVKHNYPLFGTALKKVTGLS